MIHIGKGEQCVRHQVRQGKGFVRLLPALLLIGMSLMVLQGCASTSAEYAPDASNESIDSIESLHVKKFGPDERGIDTVIADELTKMGFDVSHGPTARSPHEVDALVTYQDHWWWDITMYMIRLEIQIRDPETHAMIAEGEAYRPSLQREPPEQVAQAVLDEIFTGRP